MAHITIVAEDGIVGRAGEFRKIDLSDLPSDVFAVQGEEDTGEAEVEYYAREKKNEKRSLSEFQTWIDRYDAKLLEEQPTELEVAREEARTRLNAQLRTVVERGASWNGRRWPVDNESKEQVKEIVLSLAANGLFPGKATTFDYADLDGEVYAFDKDEFIEMAGEVRDYEYAKRRRRRELLDQIEAAESADDVPGNEEIESGWPD